METHKLRRIASISGGDRPYALFGDLGLLVWSTHNSCGDEFLAEQDESAPGRFFLAHLQKPEAGKGCASGFQQSALRSLSRQPRRSHRSEAHTSEIQSLMRISYAAFS